MSASPASGGMRKRKGGSNAILPLYHGDVSHGRPSPFVSRTKRTAWRSSPVVSILCSVLGLSAIAAIVIWVLPVSVPLPSYRKESRLTHRYYHRPDETTRNSNSLNAASHQTKSTHATAYRLITCPDGSNGYLNDDYCDCADGRDEPRTAACSHVLVQQSVFHCADGLSTIYSSRVRDGVSDCQDGSDERQLS